MPLLCWLLQVTQLAQRFEHDIDALNANLRAKYRGMDLSSPATSIAAYGKGASMDEAREVDLLRTQLEEFYERHCPEAAPRAGQVAVMYSDDIRYESNNADNARPLQLQWMHCACEHLLLAYMSTADVTPTGGIRFGRMLNEELERKYGANLISGNQALAGASPSGGDVTSKLTSQSMPPMSAQAVLRRVQDIDAKLQGPCYITSRPATLTPLYPLKRMRVRMADKLEQVRQRLASLHGSEPYQFSGSGNLAAKNAASWELASWYSGMGRDVSIHGHLGR